MNVTRNGVGVGAASATWLLSNFFGIGLVAHSSGGLILTAGSGYIAGTFISAIYVTLFYAFLPFVMAGFLIFYFRSKIVKGFDWSLERLYLWRKNK